MDRPENPDPNQIPPAQPTTATIEQTQVKLQAYVEARHLGPAVDERGEKTVL